MWQADVAGSQTLLKWMLSDSAEDVCVFLLLPAAKQLCTLPVITVSVCSCCWFCFFAYALPGSFVCHYKNIENSLETFFCSDLKRLYSIPRVHTVRWIRLCGKILFLLPCYLHRRCWIFFYHMIILPFCGSDVPKSSQLLALRVVFLDSHGRRDPELLLLFQSLVLKLSLSQDLFYTRIALCQSRWFAIFLTVFLHNLSLD